MSSVFSSRSSFDLEENALASALRNHAEPDAVLDLTQANPTKVGFSLDPAVLGAALSKAPNAQYTPSALGLETCRDVLAKDLELRGHQVSASRLLLTASTSEAYTYLFKLLCDPGDELLIPAPSYPLFDYLAQLEGVRAVSYPLGFDGAFYFDEDEIASRVTARTKAIIVVSPNNPTGTYLRQRTLEAVLDLGVPLISDEVFECYDFARPADAATATSAKRGLTFSMFGLSKQCALPQLKLAWTAVAGDDALAQAAMDRLELIGDSLLSPSSPVMNAVPVLLEEGATLRRRIVARAMTNLSTARALTHGSAVTPLLTEGGIYLVLRIPHVEGDFSAAIALLQKMNVHLHPGSFFGFASGAYFVVSLLTEEGTFAEGVARVRAFFDEA